MKIKTIRVSGYRQLQDITIDLEDSITIVGGPNNSGKTSLVELFKWVFGKGKISKIECDDLPILSCQNWCDIIFPNIEPMFLSGKEKDSIIADVCELLFPIKEEIDPIIINPVEVYIHVTYDQKKDDIRLFSDYNMDVSEESNSFYFVYKFNINKALFIDNLTENYRRLETRFKNLPKDTINKKASIRVLKKMLIALYHQSCKDTAYFANNRYNNRIEISTNDFKHRFNYETIMATRVLDDEKSQKLHTLSLNLIEAARTNEDWKTRMLSLPDEILKSIQKERLVDLVYETSIDTLQDTLLDISRTSGKNINEIAIDIDFTEESIQRLLESSTQAKYKAGDSFLGESSQGLGYSNLIFLHLQLERFKKTIDPLKVNFFIIEEPEAHMHPQMQHVFTEYLFKYYAESTGMQGLITTHSSEVIKKAKISHLRILRQAENHTSELFNLRTFYKDQKPNLKHFYDSFYTISFPDIVFADKIILYEGDTERMLIKQGLQDIEDIKPLSELYLSYIQVGGTYAYKYFPLLKFLKIKSLVITDMDYENDCTDIQTIRDSPTSNPTINHFFQERASQQAEVETGFTVKELYEKRKKQENICLDKLICITYPCEKDGYARTLEEAMLAIKFGFDVCEKKSKTEWGELKKDNQLEFIIPREPKSSIRNIVKSTFSRKTDFMYSVILGKKVEEMFPDYIKEALSWLQE